MGAQPGGGRDAKRFGDRHVDGPQLMVAYQCIAGQVYPAMPRHDDETV
jgi:hypothetical protein